MIDERYKLKKYKLLYIIELNNENNVIKYIDTEKYVIYIIPKRDSWQLDDKYIKQIYITFNITYFTNHTYNNFTKLITFDNITP